MTWANYNKNPHANNVSEYRTIEGFGNGHFPVTTAVMMLFGSILLVTSFSVMVYNIRKLKKVRKQLSYQPIDGKDVKVVREETITPVTSLSFDHSFLSDDSDDKEIPFTVPKSHVQLFRDRAESYGSNASDSDSINTTLSSRTLSYTGAYNLGTLNPELYKCPDEGDLHEYPDGHLGRMWFSLEYEKESEKLNVSILKVRNLPSRECNSPNTCDPFVRLFLLPDERRYLQSKVRRKTCNPKFDESFAFDVSKESFDERSVKFVVMDIDSLKRYIPIGQVVYPLTDYVKTKTLRYTTWRDLTKDDSEHSCRFGELHCSLCYNSNLERLTVVVIEAKDLKPLDMEETDQLDTYVKLVLLLGGKSLKSKKTRVVRKTNSPIFNESFMFKLPPAKLDSASISFHITMSKPEKQIGRLVIGGQMFTKGKPLQHWQQMTTKEKELIQDWHYLTE